MIISYKDWNLRSKILFAAVIPFIMAVMLSIPFLAIKSMESAEMHSKAFLDELAYSTAINIKTEVDKVIRDSKILSSTLDTISIAQKLDGEVMRSILNNLMKSEQSLKSISILWLIDKTADDFLSEDLIKIDGKLAYISKMDKASLNDPLPSYDFVEIMREVEAELAEGKQNKIRNEFAFIHPKNANKFESEARVITTQYTDAGNLKFVIVQDYKMPALDQMFKELKEQKLYNISLINSDKDADKANLYRDSADNYIPDHQVDNKMADVILTSKEASIDTYDEKSGNKLYSVITPISFSSMDAIWALSITHSLEQTRTAIYQNIQFVLLIIALCMSLGVSVSLVTAKNIANPITQISEALESISLGEHHKALPVQDSSDEIGQMINSAHIFKQNAMELVTAKQHAEDANVAKTEFLANMSHELRTPMHAMLSYAEIGLSRVEDKSSKIFKYFSNIHSSGERLLKLLNDLLDLSKLESGKESLNLRENSIVDIIESVKQEIYALAKSKNLSLEINSALSNSNIMCDREKISQVVMNLLSNAMKFSPEGGVINIDIYEKDYANIIISVSDQGIGIPDEELEAIFDKFIQSSKTNKGAGGTGLGLAIAKTIVEMHGGEIWAENVLTGGASFKVLLPIENIKEEECQVE